MEENLNFDMTSMFLYKELSMSFVTSDAEEFLLSAWIQNQLDMCQYR